VSDPRSKSSLSAYRSGPLAGASYLRLLILMAMLSSLLVTSMMPAPAYAGGCAADKLCRPGQNGDGSKEGDDDGETDDEPGPEDEENEECESCGEEGCDAPDTDGSNDDEKHEEDLESYNCQMKAWRAVQKWKRRGRGNVTHVREYKAFNYRENGQVSATTSKVKNVYTTPFGRYKSYWYREYEYDALVKTRGDDIVRGPIYAGEAMPIGTACPGVTFEFDALIDNLSVTYNNLFYLGVENGLQHIGGRYSPPSTSKTKITKLTASVGGHSISALHYWVPSEDEDPYRLPVRSILIRDDIRDGGYGAVRFIHPHDFKDTKIIETDKPNRPKREKDENNVLPIGNSDPKLDYTTSSFGDADTASGSSDLLNIDFRTTTYSGTGDSASAAGYFAPAGMKVAVRYEKADRAGTLQTTGWVFYRRVTGGDPINEGRTRAVIKGDAAATLATQYPDPAALLDHVLQLSDEDFDALSSAIYTYDAQGRTDGYAKGACCGSTPSATTYTYSTQSGGELDRWQQKSVTDGRVDGQGDVRTRYVNPNGTALLAIDEWHNGQGGVERAVTIREVDASGRVVKVISPEAVDLSGAYAENADGTIGVIPLQANEGQIITKTYDAAPADGLRGQYFENTTLSGTPSFERVDTGVSVDWEYADPWAWASVNEDVEELQTIPDWDDVNEQLVYPVADKAFSVKWQGTLRAPAAGDYVFHVASDDAVKLFVSNQHAPVVDEAAGGEGFYDSSTVTLAAGQSVPIVLEYVHAVAASADDRLPAGVSLFWTKPGATAMTPLDNDVQFSGEGRGGAMLSESIQRGENGPPELLKEYEYYSPHAWEANYLPGTHLYNRAKTKTRWSGEPGALVAETTTIEYRDENGNPVSYGAGGEQLNYLFHDDAEDLAAGGSGWHPKYVVTKRSLGGSPEQFLETRETRDEDGRTVFRQGPDGVIHYYQYLDTAGLDAGRMSVHVMDYAPSSPLPSGVTVPSLPGGFMVTAGTHDNRVTQYTISPVSGETLRVSEYKGSTLLTETAYLTLRRPSSASEYPDHEERRVYSEIYNDGGTIKTARPVQITISEPGGNTVSTQTAAITNWAGTNGTPDAGDGFQTISRTDYAYDQQGRQTGILVYDAYDGSGNLILKDWMDADALTSYVAYNNEGEVKSQEDPLAKKTFFTEGYAATGLSDDFLGVVMERRVYPHSKASGPIRVTWTDILGRTVRTFDATTSAADWSGQYSMLFLDNGQDDPKIPLPLTEVTRSAYFYDWRGRTEKQRMYFDLTGLAMTSTGSEGVNYYESQYLAYDHQGRVLRMKSPSGDISATVYDLAGRAIERWTGTDDTGAIAADPGAGSSNLVKISETVYDPSTGRVEAQRRLKPGLTTLSGTGADFLTDEVEYDTLGRVVWSKPGINLTPGEGNPWTHSEYNDRGNLWRSTTYKHGTTSGNANMLGQSESMFDAAGRLIESRTHEVVQGSSPPRNYLSSTYAYDSSGRQYLSQTPGAGFTKSRYDAAGRMTRSWSGTTPGSETGSDPDGDDVVVAETVYGYDLAGNVIWTESYARRHDALAGDGGLLSHPSNDGIAEVRYGATWYDDAHRPTHTVDYGNKFP